MFIIFVRYLSSKLNLIGTGSSSFEHQGVKMTYCKKCGAKLLNGSNYCSSCGTPVEEVKIEEFKISSDDLVGTVKNLIHEGNIRRIVIKDESGKVLLEIPVTIGVIGAILAPWLAALGVVAAMVANCTIMVERKA